MTQRNWLSVRLALGVAAGIAIAAFATGQIVAGSGVVVVIAASTLWVAYSVARQRRFEPGA